MKKILGFLAAIIFGACATLRSNPILPVDFSSMPPRALIHAECNGVRLSIQGIFVCEQKAPSTAKVSIKVPPLPGRVVYSNGELKKTDDFNWYPKEGFLIFKKRPIKDTWVDLDLGEIAGNFGDWPVALDVVANSSVGVIDTRGILYHRICNDQDIPCSTLVVSYECSGHHKSTGPGQIGKCDRLSGSPQEFSISLQGVRSGARIYLVSRRLGLKQAITVTASDLDSGFKNVEVPSVPNGPTLVDLAVDWFEGDARKHSETRVLLVGFDPAWTGLDQPHYLPQADHIDWTKPVFSDIMEVDLFDGPSSRERRFGVDQVLAGSKPDKDTQVSCAFAWQRDSSDLTYQCLNKAGQEVTFP